MDSNMEMRSYFSKIAELYYQEREAFEKMAKLDEDARPMFARGLAAYESGDVRVARDLRARLFALRTMYFRIRKGYLEVRKTRKLLVREAASYALEHGLKPSNYAYYRKLLREFRGLGGPGAKARMREASLMRWTQRAENVVNRSFAQLSRNAKKRALLEMQNGKE